MASATLRQVFHPQSSSNLHYFSAQPISRSPAFTTFNGNQVQPSKLCLLFSSHRSLTVPLKSSAGKNNVVATADGEGVSLGTMKLPLDTDVPRFETLLFQWANSLSQGAQLPLPVPLKVDKIDGGIRLGFVTIEDGKTEVEVYIDCVIFTPGSNQTGPPIFVATRNGALKNKVPPGEPRIMKSLLAALKKSVEIARV